MQQQDARPTPPTEVYRDENGNPISREEADKIIQGLPWAYNVALGYTWTWSGLFKRLFGRKKAA